MNFKKYTSYDIVFTLIFILIIVLTNVFSVNNAIITIFNTIFIPSLAVIVTNILNKPDTFIKICNLKCKNIKYIFDSKIVCNIDKNQYEFIVDSFAKNKKVISQDIEKYCYNTNIKYNTAILNVMYDLENCELLITIDQSLNRKYFLKQCTDIIQEYKDIFSKSDNVSITKENIQVKIIYLDNYGENITNPFVYNFFKCFNKKSFKLTFLAKNETYILINNHEISFNNDNIQKIFDDILQTLFFYKKRL